MLRATAGIYFKTALLRGLLFRPHYYIKTMTINQSINECNTIFNDFHLVLFGWGEEASLYIQYIHIFRRQPKTMRTSLFPTSITFTYFKQPVRKVSYYFLQEETTRNIPECSPAGCAMLCKLQYVNLKMTCRQWYQWYLNTECAMVCSVSWWCVMCTHFTDEYTAGHAETSAWWEMGRDHDA